jgi:hypothetical protein
MQIKKGQLIALTRGSYSDYCLIGHVRALCDFDAKIMEAKFKAECENDMRILIPWMIRNNFIDPAETTDAIELWLGYEDDEIDIGIDTSSECLKKSYFDTKK